MLRASKFILPTIVVALLCACEKSTEQNTNQPAQVQNAMPANHPPITQAGAATNLGNLQGGTIQEVLISGGYTYVRVERDGVEMWAAGPQSELAQGALVGWYESTVMRNFMSKSLNRSFPEIHFVGQFIDPAKATISNQTQAPRQNQPTENSTGGVIKEVLVGGGYTYVNVNINGQEVWAAGPMADLKVGEAVNWSGGSKMNNFTSSTLGRTFAEVYFVGGFNKGTPNEQAAPDQGQQSGIVTQVIESSGYTYLEINTGEQQIWLAAPESTVKTQDKVSWANGSVMHNFQSRSLDRTFKEIVFVDSITVI